MIKREISRFVCVGSLTVVLDFLSYQSLVWMNLIGFDLAKGKKLENLLRNKKTIAEGAYTVKAIKKLGKKLKLSLPLNDAIYKILYQNKNINNTISELLNRPIIKEN